MALAANATLQVFLVLFSLSLSSLYEACTIQERETLLSFLSSLSSPIKSWYNTSNSSCCTWEGITCDLSSSVTQLSLPSKGLTGQISPVLSNLTNLSHLNLSNNSLFGPLPHELLSLSTSLTILDLSFNSLSGPIRYTAKNPLIQVLNLSGNLFNGPIPVINSTSFLSLNVSNNGLTGLIPASLCTLLPFLILLDISYNEIEGGISNEIGNCSVLKMFRAGHNKLTGSLPDKLVALTSLEHLYLYSNQIEGSLSGYQITQLVNLTTLNLGSNKLTGYIPGSIGELRNLQYLVLSTNNLNGTIPPEIAKCTGLRQLDFRANNLTGDLQLINFTRLSNLTQLDLYSNNFVGEIPNTIYTCMNLDALRLSRNNLYGEISPEIQNLKNLHFLSLGENSFKNLTGALRILSACKNLTTLLLSKNLYNEALPTFPNWETRFGNIEILSLGGCNLTDNIPFWLSKMTKLRILDLSRNQFTGPVPIWLNTLPSLFYLDLSNNYLSGNIPQEITNLPLLNSDHEIIQLNPHYLELPIYKILKNQYYNQLLAFPPAIFLSNNLLNGTIPNQIGQLTMLHILNISNNDLSGFIPDPLGNLTNLEILDLSGNKLTGMIPISLTRLHFLATFSVAFNDLNGPVPTGGQFDTFSNFSYEGNPNLCGSILMRPCNSLPSGEIDPSVSSSGLSTTIIALTFGIFFGVVLIVFIFSIFFVVSSKGKI